MSHGCDRCDKSFPTKGKLDRHINGVHLNIRPFKCDRCDKSFQTTSDLKRHISAHHDREKTHKCNQCDYKCNQSSTMKAHIKAVHQNERPHSCPHCEYKAKENTHLQDHIKRKHIISKEYSCNICDMRFVTRGEANSHIKGFHNKIRDFECKNCPHKFSTSGHLTRHSKTCTGKLKCSHGEMLVMNALDDFGVSYEFDTRHEVKNITYLRWDFIITSGLEPMFIEFDGEQHYKQRDNGKYRNSLDAIKKRDKIKDDYCMERGYKLLRIPYTEKSNIKELILDFISEITWLIYT